MTVKGVKLLLVLVRKLLLQYVLVLVLITKTILVLKCNAALLVIKHVSGAV